MEMARLIEGLDATAACHKLIDEANAIGTLDNVTVAVVRVLGETPEPRR